jgi:tRNA nucleotidyltransferase (CCA-adding enzyme)
VSKSRDPRALSPPPAVLEIGDTLERAGYDTWCVGGAVRDALLGYPNSDWDLATAATPKEVRRLFRGRVVPIGEEHGTMGVLDRQDVMHEVTTFRRDVRTDGRHADVEFGASLDEDLARRDFTINAIAYKPRTATLHDPFGGRGDLERGVIRAVGAPADRMREDRLRALRAIRFAARFEFEIEPATWAAVEGSASQLTRLSPERVSQELEKTMQQVRRPARAIGLWKTSGALAVLIPALAKIDDVTVASLDCLPVPDGKRADARMVDRLSALFWGLDAGATQRAAVALRFANARARWMGELAERWQLLGGELGRELGQRPDDAVVRRWTAEIGRTRLTSFWRIAAARWGAARRAGIGAPSAGAVRSVYRRSMRVAYGGQPLTIGELAVDGNDLVQWGIAKGPKIREILQGLLEAVLEEPARNTPEQLKALVSKWGA